MLSRRGLLLIFFLVIAVGGIAQQVPLYSQYMLNGFLLNPAIAGSEGYTAVNLTAREQWIGFKDTPGTYALSFQSRVLRKSYISKSSSVRKRQRYSSRSGKVGVGGYVFTDNNGAMNRTGIKASYAYHLFFGNSQLSMGLAFSGFQLSLDDEKINLLDPSDPTYTDATGTVFIPDADFGIYFDTPDYFIGLSAEQILDSEVMLGGNGFEDEKIGRSYYLMAGYDIPVSEYIVLTPSMLTKYSQNSRAVQTDFNVKAYYDQTYWGGLTYRTGYQKDGGSAIIILVGLSIDRLIFGYAFDVSLSNIMRYSFGTHEFIFAAKFGDSARRYRWLNRY